MGFNKFPVFFFCIKKLSEDHVEYSSLIKPKDCGNFSKRYIKHQYQSFYADLEKQNYNNLFICLELVLCSSQTSNFGIRPVGSRNGYYTS